MRRMTLPLMRCLLLVFCVAPMAAFAQRDDSPSPEPTPVSPTISIAASAPRPAPPRLVYAGAPLPLLRVDSAPYRDAADGEICVAPESLTPLGVIFMVDEVAGKVTLSAGDGTASVTVDKRTPPPGTGSRGVFVPAMAVIEGLGGKGEWETKTNTLFLRAVIQGVERVGNDLLLRASLPILPMVKRDETGKRLMIDVVGAEIGKLPKTLSLGDTRIAQTRTGQFESDTARIVLEMKDASTLAILSDKPATEITLRLLADKKVAAIKIPKTIAAPPAPAMIRSVTFRRVSDTRAQFLISASSVTAVRTALQGAKLTLDLLNATLGPDASAALSSIRHPFLKAAQWAAGDNAVASLSLSLNRVVSYSVKPDRKGNVLLDLTLPRGAGGKLAGKTFVIDPGHGGGDSGATGSGAMEKNVTLAIGLKLADLLRDAGANVVMTRADDFFLPVNDRPRIANRINADFFVSVHADSTDGSRSTNGATAYFHAADEDCRTLAHCVISRIGGTGIMKSRGARTDYIRFPGNGYGVLRNSQMPAILCECGFMSNPGDVVKLLNPEKQQQIAQAIRAGLRDYIEGFAAPTISAPAAEPDAAPIEGNESENPMPEERNP